MKSSNLQRVYALSPLQEGILFHTLSAPDSATYFEQFSFTINAVIDPVALAKAWQKVIDRHAVLRSSFHWKKLQKPFQVVHQSVDLPFEQHDWSTLSAADREQRLRAFLANDRARGFDLSVPPLLRLMLIRLTPWSWQCVVSFHHILLDGWSVAIVFREASLCYEAYSQGREPALETPPPFEDYIAWLQKQDFGRAEAFWRDRLVGYHGPVPISGDRAPGTIPGLSEPYGSHQATLSREVTARLQNLARVHELTVNTIVQGAWSVLLSHYTDERDVVFGATGSGRPVELKGIESMVGLFINTLPVRVQVDFDQLLIPWLENLQAIQFQARQYEHTPLVDVQGWSSVPRGTPLFETLVGFENYPQMSTSNEVSSAVQLAEVFERTNYPISLIVSPGSELSIVLLYVSSRFDHGSSARMLRQFQTLLEAIATNADRRLAELSLSDEAERHRLLIEWNQTAQEYPRDICVNQLFEKWVRQTPDALAVWCDQEQLTYRELNERANRVANALRRRSVSPGSRVAICMKRTAAMVAAILGVTKSGCAYVPLDAAYPQQSLALMLHDCGARTLLTTSDLAEKLPTEACDLVFMDSDEVTTASNEALLSAVIPEQLAYLIYTSGSTGRPRGVVVQHRSLMNLVSWHQREYAVTASDRATQIAGAAFDASVWELWPYLTAGASVRVVSDTTRNSPADLIQCLASEKITLSFLPTALAEMVLELPWPEGVCLRALLTGGDKFRHLPEQPLPFRVINHYGPTENTVVTTFAVTEPRDLTPPIGRPIANVKVYVLNRKGKLAPLGATGELCVAGDSLATAYHELPDVTALKFVPDSFTGVPGSRLYRTGDRVRYREDGNLEFHGRLDAQIKVRGMRVEPGEVESTLTQHPAVREAAVVVSQEVPEDPRLVAYVVGKNGDNGSNNNHWETEQIGRWKRIYDDTYAGTRPPDPHFNITGWNSTYTGTPIPVEEMREQVDATVERIRALKPRRILEIGCGTGLLLFRLAPHALEYVATDFSATAMRQVKEQLTSLPHVNLLHASADDFSGIQPGFFDVVVLNSVVQYFPSAAYLERALRGAVAATRPGGHVFIGDVRSLTLLNAFHASVEVASAGAGTQREEIQESVRRRLANEPELVIGEEWFTELQRRVPQITGVATEFRRGWARNELTAFRYDVWLEVNGTGTQQLPRWVFDWQEIGSLSSLRSFLEKNPAVLSLKGIPNARVAEAVAAATWLFDGPEGSTVVAWRDRWKKQASSAIEPEAIWELASTAGYDAHIRLGAKDDTMDAFLCHRSQDAGAAAKLWPNIKPAAETLRSQTNNPGRTEANQQFITVLRDYLRQRLPDHMVPSKFLVLDSLPLTPNGKVDRKSLPALNGKRAASVTPGFVAPQSKVEQQIAQVWQEVLAVDSVGVHDNFFDLGGHSLLMVRVHGRLAEVVEADISIVDLLHYPTVASLASHVSPSEEQPAGASPTFEDRVNEQRAAFVARFRN